MSQARRRYQQVAGELRALIAQKRYRVGDRIDTERQISEQLGIGRSVAREAVMMLEIEGLVEVRKGSGIYVSRLPSGESPTSGGDIGPFELLQARQVLETVHKIMRRVNRYLVVKAAISAVTAALIWAIFRVQGLDLAGAVAMLTFILNFIPTLGSIAATVITIAMVLAQTGDPAVTLTVGGLTVAVQFIIGNVFDPMLLGQTLRLSSFGIVLSLAFWGVVWGIAGTFLAVPIMVAIMIVCAQIPWLRPVAIMLSQEGLPEQEPPSGLRR